MANHELPAEKVTILRHQGSCQCSIVHGLAFVLSIVHKHLFPMQETETETVCYQTFADDQAHQSLVFLKRRLLHVLGRLVNPLKSNKPNVLESTRPSQNMCSISFDRIFTIVLAQAVPDTFLEETLCYANCTVEESQACLNKVFIILYKRPGPCVSLCERSMRPRLVWRPVTALRQDSGS